MDRFVGLSDAILRLPFLDREGLAPAAIVEHCGAFEGYARDPIRQTFRPAGRASPPPS